MPVIVIRRGDTCVVYTGGTYLNPRKPVLTIPPSGLDSMPSGAFDHITPAVLRAVREWLERSTANQHKDKILTAIHILGSALESTGKEQLDAEEVSLFEEVLGIANARLSSAKSRLAVEPKEVVEVPFGAKNELETFSGFMPVSEFKHH